MLAQACDLWPGLAAPLGHAGRLPGSALPPTLPWSFPSIALISEQLLPSALNTPHALQEPPHEGICKGVVSCPPGLGLGVWNQRDPSHLLLWDPGAMCFERQAGVGVTLGCGRGPKPHRAVRMTKMPTTQLLNQGFSALPLSSGAGCPARLPGPEDLWSGSASSWVKRVGQSFSFWK